MRQEGKGEERKRKSTGGRWRKGTGERRGKERRRERNEKRDVGRERKGEVISQDGEKLMR